MKTRTKKILSLILAILFTTTNISWSAPALYLRPASFANRVQPLDYDPKHPPVAPLEERMRELETARDKLDPGLSFVVNPEVVLAQIARAQDAAGGDQSKVMLAIDLCAGRGTRFERAQMAQLEMEHDLTAEIRQELETQGVQGIDTILADIKNRLNSPDYETAASAVLVKHGLIDQVLTKMEYPIPGPGFDNRPLGSFGLTTVVQMGMPIVVIAGYKAEQVMPTIGAAGLTQAHQPGFAHTRTIVAPGRYPLGTGLGTAQALWAIPNDFTGFDFITMGDAPFVNEDIIKLARVQYEQTRSRMPSARCITLTGTIVGDPLEPGYGRMIFREENGARILDRIIEVKDICALIGNSLRDKKKGVKQAELSGLQSERFPKADLIEQARASAAVGAAIQKLHGRFEVNGTISIPDERNLDADQIELRAELDDALAEFGLLRKKITGELLDGWELMGIRDYNSGLYVIDHQAFRGSIGETVNNNASSEYYLPDVPLVLERQGYATICVSVPPEDSWRLEGINTPDELRAAIIKKTSAEGARLMLKSLPGPFPLSSIQNAKGDTVVEGADRTMELLLQERGCERPAGQAHIMPPDEVIALMRRMAEEDPFVGIERKTYKILEGGQEKTIEREVVYNTLYRDFAFNGKTTITDAEMRYLFDTLEEDSVSYIILLFLKGAPVRARYLAGQIDPQDTARAQERAQLLQSAQAYEALWRAIERQAPGLSRTSPSAGAMQAWSCVDRMRIEQWSGLELGDPYRNPFREYFGDMAAPGERVARLQQEVLAVANNRVMWSISGIRAVMGGGRIFGNLTLPQNYDSDAFQDTVPTDAMLVIAATQADVFAELLNLGPAAFCTKYEASIKATIVVRPEDPATGRTKDDVDREREKKYQRVRANFIEAWNKSQEDKPARPAGTPAKVLVAKDSRSTGSRLADIQIRTLLARGIDVEYAGTGSVCEAAVATLRGDYNGSFVDTASHNPRGYNGLKPFSGTGEVFNPALAPVFMTAVKSRLRSPANAGEIVRLVNEGVSADDVRRVYNNVERVKSRCVEADWTYRKQVITGTRNPVEMEGRLAAIRKFVTERKLAIVVNPNGGARQDAEFYRQVLGFHVIETNARPRVDMVGPLCPHDLALGEARQQLLGIKEEAQKEGYTIVWYQYNDTDGDRVNKMFFDENGNLVARPDMPQILFATDAISYVMDNYDFENHRPTKPIAVACNDATATLLEGLAERFGFIIIRSQTGEAMVVDAMNRIDNMAFGEAKRLDLERRAWRPGMSAVQGEVYVPKCLHQHGEEWFKDFAAGQHCSVDNLKNEAVMGGEGSNGSDFTFALLVRDPLNKMKMALGLLDPVSGPQRVKEFFARLGRTISDEELQQWWEIDTASNQPGKNIGPLMSRLLSAMPKSRATDTFSPGSGVKVMPPTGMPEPMKRYLDELLSDRNIIGAIRNTIANLIGVSPERITYKPVSSDDICRIGWGAGPDETPFGRMPRDGGYAIRFYIMDNEDWEVPLCAMWARESLTEIGTLRVLGYALIDSMLWAEMPLAEGQQDYVAEQLHRFMETELLGIVDPAIALTVKEILEADPAHTPDALRESIASLPPLPSGDDPFVALQNRLRNYVQDNLSAFHAALTDAQQRSRPLEQVHIDRARFLHTIGVLTPAQYGDILRGQKRLAEGDIALYENASVYLRELESGQFLTAANPYPNLDAMGHDYSLGVALSQAV